MTRKMMPVPPHLLMVGLGVSITLALAVSVYNPIPKSVAYIQQVDDSYAASSSTPAPGTYPPSPTPCPTNCTAPGTPAPSLNLVTNGDMEIDSNGNGKPDYWTEDARVKQDLNAYRNRYSMGFRAKDNSTFEINQTAGASPNVKYTFAANIMISNLVLIGQAPDSSFSFKFTLSWRDKNKVQLRSDTVQTFRSVTNGWKQVTKAYTSPANTQYVRVRLLSESLGVDVFVDNVGVWR